VTAESPVFTKAYDLLKWVLPTTARFPRAQRFVLARHVEEAAFGLHRALLRAAADGGSGLMDADRELAALRTYLRLSCELRLLSVNQYEHAARLADEVGRLIGGWKRTVRAGREAGVGYRAARRVLEQQPDQPANGEPERQHAGQPEQQHRVPLRE
jgi:hypothetical protein